MARRVSAVTYEAALAALATAGVREVVQANVTPSAGAVATYTIANSKTRRAMITHMGLAGDIRFKYRPQGAAGDAAATNIPISPNTRWFVDCEKDDILSFWGVTGGVVVYIMEIE